MPHRVLRQEWKQQPSLLKLASFGQKKAKTAIFAGLPNSRKLGGIWYLACVTGYLTQPMRFFQELIDHHRARQITIGYSIRNKIYTNTSTHQHSQELTAR